MRIIRRIVIILIMQLIWCNGFSAAYIYLLSKTDIDRENLLVSDICKIEGDKADFLLNLVIPETIYSDSIVDREELYTFLCKNTDEGINIYGSGVRVTKNVKEKKEIVIEKPVLVKKGELVELSYKKNGITIEMTGKALSKGCEEEEIDFRLSTGKVVKGRMKSFRKAEVSI